MKQKLIAVKPLTYATRRLQAGDEFEATRADARVLVAVKRAAFADQQRDADPIEIPSDWREQHHMKLIAIAKALGAEASNKAEATAAIEAELARRSAN